MSSGGGRGQAALRGPSPEAPCPNAFTMTLGGGGRTHSDYSSYSGKWLAASYKFELHFPCDPATPLREREACPPQPGCRRSEPLYARLHNSNHPTPFDRRKCQRARLSCGRFSARCKRRDECPFPEHPERPRRSAEWRNQAQKGSVHNSPEQTVMTENGALAVGSQVQGPQWGRVCREEPPG